MTVTPRFNLVKFRKCIRSMTDGQLVGLGKTCKSLSNNVFQTQFAACKTEWNRRHKRAAA
jgi:hypothetical protein